MLGKNEWNRSGYYEHVELVRINEFLLEQQNCQWADAHRFRAQAVQGEDRQHAQQRLKWLLHNESEQTETGQTVVVLKDPRLCITWPALDLRPDAVVFSYRHPLAVARSLAVRDGCGIAVGLALWELYNVRICVHLDQLMCIPICYDDLLSNEGNAISELSTHLQERPILRARLLREPPDPASMIRKGDNNCSLGDCTEFLLAWQAKLWERLRARDFQAIAKTGVSAHSMDLLRQHAKLLKYRKMAHPGSLIKAEVSKAKEELESIATSMDTRLRALESALGSSDTSVKNT